MFLLNQLYHLHKMEEGEKNIMIIFIQEMLVNYNFFLSKDKLYLYK